MTLERKLSLEDLLVDPIVRLVMAQDGFVAEDIRHLMRDAAARVADTRHQTRPVIPRAVQHCCKLAVDAA